MKFFPRRQDGFVNHPVTAILLTLFNVLGAFWIFHVWQNPAGSYGPGAGGGGGVTTVSSLPALPCTPGALVNLTINGVGYGVFSCTGNVWIPDNPAQTISPYAYGAIGHVRFTYNASWSNASTTVSCSNGECSFQCPGAVYPCTSGTGGCPSLTCDAGKIVKGAAMTPGVQTAATTGGVEVPQGTISTVTNSTTITVSTTTTAACPSGSLTVCTLSWGIQDDTTALNAARDAAWSNGNRCIAYQLPADNFYFSGPVFNAPASLLAGNPCSTTSQAAGAGSDLTSSGPSLYGAGPGTTNLIPLTYNFAGCTFGTAAQACNGTMPNLQAHDFSVNGLGDVVGGTHAVTLWEDFGSNSGLLCAGGTTVQDVNLSNWGLTSVSTIGFRFGANSCNDAFIKNVNVVMFGANTCRASLGGNSFNAISLFCFGAGLKVSAQGDNVLVFDAPTNSLARFNTWGSQFICGLGPQNALVVGPASGNVPVWNSTGDNIGTIANCATQTFGITPQIMRMDFNDDDVYLTSGTITSGLLLRGTGAGAVMHLRNSKVTATGTNNQLLTTGATDQVFDDGGNIFLNGTVANTPAAGTWFFGNSACQTAQVSGNFADGAGIGTSTFGSVSGNGCKGQVTVTYAGTLATPATFTMTFPSSWMVAPFCSVSDMGGTNPFPTQIDTTNTPPTSTTLTVKLTFAAAPVATQTDVFQWNCSN